MDVGTRFAFEPFAPFFCSEIILDELREICRRWHHSVRLGELNVDPQLATLEDGVGDVALAVSTRFTAVTAFALLFLGVGVESDPFWRPRFRSGSVCLLVAFPLVLAVRRFAGCGEWSELLICVNVVFVHHLFVHRRHSGSVAPSGMGNLNM